VPPHQGGYRPLCDTLCLPSNHLVAQAFPSDHIPVGCVLSFPAPDNDLLEAHCDSRPSERQFRPVAVRREQVEEGGGGESGNK
jgi:hypothetical protein